MSIILTRFRDQIIMNKDFAKSIENELKSKSITAGTILLAAREILLDHAYTFSYSSDAAIQFPGKYDIVLVADRFDSRDGKIDISGSVGSRPAHGGQTGTKGDDAVFGDNVPGQPGGKGFPGDPGGPGSNGKNIKIFCNELVDADITSNGGPGGTGGRGGAGGPGGDGVGHLPNGRQGPGGNGGQGGRGGDAGRIELVFCTAPNRVVDHHLKSRGGGPGNGGPPGGGGPPVFNDPATEGPIGIRGHDSSPDVKHVEIPELWEKIRLELRAEDLNNLAEHFVKVGEYRVRSAENNDDIKLAMHMFVLALALNPNDTLAQNFKNQILSNQNVLGFDRNLDIIPKFNEFDQNATSSLSIVKMALEIALHLISNASLINVNKEITQRAINDMKRNERVLDLEIENAKKELDLRNEELNQINRRIIVNSEAIEARKEELENISFGLWATTMFQAIMVLRTFDPKSIAGLKDFFMNKIMQEEFQSKSGIMLDNINYKEGTVSLPQAGQGNVGGLKAIVSTSSMIIDRFEVFSDIASSTSDPVMKVLLKEVAELSFAAELSNLRIKQAEILKSIAEEKKSNWKSEIEEAEIALRQLTGNLIMEGQTAKTVIIFARKYLDIVLEYIFKAARSLEIYMYSNITHDLRYDFGYVHPDLEEDAYSRLNEVNGSENKLIELFTQYSESLSRIVQVVTFRNELENYRDQGQGLQRALEVIKLESIHLQEFQNNHHVGFEIKLEDMPINRFESKLIMIRVGLIGATSSEPFECILQHFGSSKIKLIDGSIINRTEKPRTSLIQANTTLDQFNTPLPDISNETLFLQSYWGRSPATTWFLSIEEDVFRNKHVDLSSLSEIRIALLYECFIL